MLLPFSPKALMLMLLCYKQNLVFQLKAVQPAVVGPTALNWETKFCYGQRNKNNKAKLGFHRTFFSFFLLFLSILLWDLSISQQDFQVLFVA